jgi:hypothetical protein
VYVCVSACVRERERMAEADVDSEAAFPLAFIVSLYVLCS